MSAARVASVASEASEKKKPTDIRVITAIVTRKSRWFGLVTDTKVYFDTKGVHSHPREAPATSKWKMTDHCDGNRTRFIADKSESSRDGTIIFHAEGITGHPRVPGSFVGYYTLIGESTRRKDFVIERSHDSKFYVTFPSVFDIDDVMFMADFIIRHL